MIDLRRKGIATSIPVSIVGRVSKADSDFVVVSSQENELEQGFGGKVVLTTKSLSNFPQPLVHSVKSLEGITVGDVIQILPSGVLHVLFRAGSLDNSLFTTDQCNSNCLMCSQPPKKVDDIEYHFELNCSIIRLMPATTEIVGITGGEPTLLGQKLFEMFRMLTEMHPHCLVHILTNGRAFAYQSFVKQYLSVSTENHIWGIPIYSDFYSDHDYIVQAKGAFNETIQGIYNLARIGARIELRIVVHKLTVLRLKQLTKFISKNLTFVERVAFMGLEYIGYTPFNDQLLWIDPLDFQEELHDAVVLLDDLGINVSIYNLPLCLLPKEVRRFAIKSISDWKREYLTMCTGCALKTDCGGVFGTSKKLSENIQAIRIE
ncbi:His-Xaa-Ser system radical SAM maturase HxsC [Ravibacter arvi]|uniref:His-Xaa-Ser system radical SAM maturase HxsC n=1 Tax=Ravibacter arvi TaxID=2051041 RepID=A0ABP8M4W4_9BACT